MTEPHATDPHPTDPPVIDSPVIDSTGADSPGAEPQGPAEFAAAIGAARQRLIGFIGSCAGADWLATPLGSDPRPVGVIVDHVAHSYEYLAAWMRGILAGQRVTISTDIVDAYNAEHATAAAQVSQPEAAEHLGRSGDAIIQLVSGLNPADLDARGGRVRRLAQIAIRHADDHRAEEEAALAAAR